MTQYIAIVPEDVDLDKQTRYLRLPHPRTAALTGESLVQLISGQPQLYLPSGKGISEVVKLAGAKGRTWFIGDDKVDRGSGYEGPSDIMLLHVPVDPLFIVIPLALSLIPSEGTGPFQPLSDLISTFASAPAFALAPGQTYNADVGRLLELPSARRAFRACCARKVRPQPTTYFRPSRDAVLALLRKKVAHFAHPENFEMFDHLVRGLSRDGLLGDAAAGLVEQARVKAALEHVAQYLPLTILAQLAASYDLSPLQAYLADRSAHTLAAAQHGAAKSADAAKAAGTNKRKAQLTSRGVEQLKKANTGGMSKLTSFFKKK